MRTQSLPSSPARLHAQSITSAPSPEYLRRTMSRCRYIPATRKTPRQELPRPAHPLPTARLHDLRHVHATTLLLAGVPVHVVAERLGHADAAITLRVYAHVLRQHADGVAATFAAAVDENTTTEIGPDDDDPD